MSTLADALERAKTDVRFRAKLLTDPEAALSELGLSDPSARLDVSSLAETIDLEPNELPLSDDVDSTQPVKIRRPRKAHA